MRKEKEKLAQRKKNNICLRGPCLEPGGRGRVEGCGGLLPRRGAAGSRMPWPRTPRTISPGRHSQDGTPGTAFPGRRPAGRCPPPGCPGPTGSSPRPCLSSSQAAIPVCPPGPASLEHLPASWQLPSFHPQAQLWEGARCFRSGGPGRGRRKRTGRGGPREDAELPAPTFLHRLRVPGEAPGGARAPGAGSACRACVFVGKRHWVCCMWFLG